MENLLFSIPLGLIYTKFYCTLTQNLLSPRHSPSLTMFLQILKFCPKKYLIQPFVYIFLLYNKTLYAILINIFQFFGFFKRLYSVHCLITQPYSKPVLLAQLTAFLQYISVTRSRTKNTVRNAKSILSRFVIFLTENYDTSQLTEITTPILLEFLKIFKAPSYRYTIIYYLRQFFDFLKIENNPARQIKFPKINPSSNIKFLEKHATIKLIKTLNQRVNVGKNLRENAIIQLILFTGLRADEVLNLKKQDILESGVILIRDSKTYETRVVKGPKQVLNAISDYHKSFPNFDNPYVFYANNRKTDKSLSYATLRTIIKEIFLSAGINEKGINIHALRHTFARTLVQGGINREEIQKFLGHKNLKTTEIYTRLFDTDILKRSSKVHKLIQEAYKLA